MRVCHRAAASPTEPRRARSLGGTLLFTQLLGLAQHQSRCPPSTSSLVCCSSRHFRRRSQPAARSSVGLDLHRRQIGGPDHYAIDGSAAHLWTMTMLAPLSSRRMKTLNFQAEPASRLASQDRIHCMAGRTNTGKFTRRRSSGIRLSASAGPGHVSRTPDRAFPAWLLHDANRLRGAASGRRSATECHERARS